MIILRLWDEKVLRRQSEYGRYDIIGLRGYEVLEIMIARGIDVAGFVYKNIWLWRSTGIHDDTQTGCWGPMTTCGFGDPRGSTRILRLGVAS